MNAVAYAVSLAKKHTDEIGFIPQYRYDQAAADDRLFLQSLNDDPCGFLLAGPMRANTPVHIYQTVIQTDARRILQASHLVDRLAAQAAAADATAILLRVAADLPAVQFWLANGFECLGETPGGTRRRRRILQFRRLLVPATQRTLWPVDQSFP